MLGLPTAKAIRQETQSARGLHDWESTSRSGCAS